MRRFFIVINPRDGTSSIARATVIRCDRPHLRVDESISEQELLTCESWVLVAELVPLARYLDSDRLGQTRLVGG